MAAQEPAMVTRQMSALKGRALAAYLVVCIVWGSTYLAIRIGVGELPPFLFAGLRFLVAGGLLAALAPALGVASLFVVTVALWMAFFDAVIPGGTGELNWRVVVGLVAGFIGTALLVGASPSALLHADLRGPIALTCASASWSLGSVYAKRHPTQSSPYIGAAIQMIVGGALVALAGTLLGEWSTFHLTARGAEATAYLVVFGSIVGYSAYVYALHHASPTIVCTYASVTPVIAVFLGWLLLHEPITARTVVATSLILGAVVWIQFSARLVVRRSGGRAVTATAEQAEA